MRSGVVCVIMNGWCIEGTGGEVKHMWKFQIVSGRVFYIITNIEYSRILIVYGPVWSSCLSTEACARIRKASNPTTATATSSIVVVVLVAVQSRPRSPASHGLGPDSSPLVI